MTEVGRSLFQSSLVRICTKEITSWYMSPFQIGLVRIFVRIFMRIFMMIFVMLLNRAQNVIVI